MQLRLKHKAKEVGETLCPWLSLGVCVCVCVGSAQTDEAVGACSDEALGGQANSSGHHMPQGDDEGLENSLVGHFLPS